RSGRGRVVDPVRASALPHAELPDLADLHGRAAVHRSWSAVAVDRTGGIEHAISVPEEGASGPEPVAPGRAGSARGVTHPAGAAEIDPGACVRPRVRGSFGALPPDEADLPNHARRGSGAARLGVAP